MLSSCESRQQTTYYLWMALPLCHGSLRSASDQYQEHLLMASQNTKPTLLHNIKPFGVYFKIKVLVGRIWTPRAYNSDAFDGLHYLLIDETGDTIEGIIEEDYYQNMTKTMEEGKIYEITKFHNKRYTATTKLVNHEVQLLFNRFTQFIEVDETMSPPPRYGFQLLQYNEFTAQLHKQKVLADLYGCMKTISTEYEVSLDAKNKTVREIVLTNLRREEIKVSLWGDPAQNLDADAIEQMPQPVFVVITSLRVTKFQRINE
uniref:replication protein A 70 kDa DNA-binding subunit B-like n=1 Tax=Fragaria vesca subsp. vesca TaxID=101020 RepID=UPI0005CAE58C|nr:PREDICTED: replication protein A 70 kDa DNA-binding subunit B-like [Fragaria vesca subsp. vesca]